MNTTAEVRSDKWKALTGTLLFHGVIFLFFFLYVFKNPDPPLFSDAAGVEVNFGYMEDGTGDVQPEPETQTATAVPQQKQQEVKEEDDEVMTQDVEEAPVIQKKEVKKEIKKTPEPKKPEKEPVKQPVVNQNALYKPKSKTGSEGETGNPGDQGIEAGSLYSKNHGTEMGHGDHGDGDGINGNADKGYSFSLEGRTVRVAPKISDDSQDQGKVVVDVTVDKLGNVVNVSAPARGSTTTNGNLVRKSKEAAMKTKFSPSPKGVEEQRGTITFVFIVR